MAPPEPRDVGAEEEPADRDVPPGTGRARELSRGRRRVRPAADGGGRRHHLGTVPQEMPVLLPDGSTRTTRAAVVQLTAATRHRLRELEAELEADMRTAAAEGRYEEAALLRDELTATRAEVARRARHDGPTPPVPGGRP